MLAVAFLLFCLTTFLRLTGIVTAVHQPKRDFIYAIALTVALVLTVAGVAKALWVLAP